MLLGRSFYNFFPPGFYCKYTQKNEGTIWNQKWFFRVMPWKNHFWFHKEPFKPGFFKEQFPLRVLQRTYKGVSKNFKNMVLYGTISGST